MVACRDVVICKLDIQWYLCTRNNMVHGRYSMHRIGFSKMPGIGCQQLQRRVVTVHPSLASPFRDPMYVILCYITRSLEIIFLRMTNNSARCSTTPTALMVWYGLRKFKIQFKKTSICGPNVPTADSHPDMPPRQELSSGTVPKWLRYQHPRRIWPKWTVDVRNQGISARHLWQPFAVPWDIRHTSLLYILL